LSKPKIYLTTPHFRAREASGDVQRKIFFFLFLLGMGSLFYLLFFFPFWEVREVNIVGEENIEQEEAEEIVRDCLRARRLLVFPKKNLIIVSKEEIETKLEERFAQIETVEVSKEFPDILKVVILEKEPVAVWATGAGRDLFLPTEAFLAPDAGPEEEVGEAGETGPDFSASILDYPEDSVIEYYFVDQNGVLGDPVSFAEISEKKLPIIYDQSFRQVKPRDVILSSEFFEFLFQARDLLPLKTQVTIEEFIVPIPESRDLYVKVDKGYQIFFDTEASLSDQVEALSMLLEKEISKENKQIKYYADLRVEGLVYYK